MREMRAHHEHIVGGNEESRKAAAQEFQQAFEEGAEKIEGEFEKTEEDYDLLRETEATVDRMVAAWGGNPKDISTSHVHFLPLGAVERRSDGEIRHGSADSMTMMIEAEITGSRFIDAHTLAHELFHIKSFKSGQIDRDSNIIPYRSGLNMVDRHNKENADYPRVYFRDLEEAIVAESAGRFSDAMRQDPRCAEELEGTRQLLDLLAVYLREVKGTNEEMIDQIKEKVICIANAHKVLLRVRKEYPDNIESQGAYITGFMKGVWGTPDVYIWEREEERERMYKLLDRIIAASGGKYTGRNELFEIFAKANYSGNYLPMARVVEESLGKGAFREVAEEFSREPQFAKRTWKTKLMQFLREE